MVESLKDLDIPIWLTTFIRTYDDYLIANKVDRKFFGNFVFNFLFGNVEIKIIRDRGEIYIDRRIAGNSDWENVAILLNPKLNDIPSGNILDLILS